MLSFGLGSITIQSTESRKSRPTAITAVGNCGVMPLSKGTRRERDAVELYQRAGFATYRPATVQYGENDIFGLFDLLAVSPSHDSVRAVQVKSNRALGIEAWTRHTALWRRLGWVTEYAVPVDGEGWVLYDAGQDPVDGRRAARVVYDEREDDCVGPNVDTPLSLGDGLVEYLRGES